MRLWLSRGSEVSIRDQLVTQVVLSILSGELNPGQRLPSTRELARRFHIHANTVSAGYRELERNQWVEFLKGSGIFVRNQRPDNPPAAVALDQLITNFFQSARETGATLSTIRSRLRHWLEMQPPDHFLLIEPDAALAQILISEIQPAVTLPVKSCGTDGDLSAKLLGAVPMALSMNEKKVRNSLSDNAELLVLHMRSPGASLAPHLPAPSTALVGVASSWPTFLKTARTMLVAASFPPECLVLRDASKGNWQRGLKQVAAVVCDSLTARELRDMPRVLVFPLLSDSCLQDLRHYEEFLRQPFAP
ncbi:MAG: GntR family transcriptional regulator [Terriglobales bacterium]